MMVCFRDVYRKQKAEGRGQKAEGRRQNPKSKVEGLRI
jgi:hypothetical protein